MKRVVVVLNEAGCIQAVEHPAGQEPIEVVLVNWLDQHNEYDREEPVGIYQNEEGDAYSLDVQISIPQTPGNEFPPEVFIQERIG